jgi:hypothetical protein
MESIVVCLADGHSGFDRGLLGPHVTLLDEDEQGNAVPWQPQQREFQKWLWGRFLAYIERIKEIAQDIRIVVFYVGDACWGIKHPGTISARMSDQVAIAAQSLAPLLALPNVVSYRQIYGTEAHNFGQGSAEILLSKQIQSAFPEMDVGCAMHMLGTIDGVPFDVAHHGPMPGSRLWLRGNVMRYGLKDILLSDANEGSVPARVIVRAHYHTYVRVVEPWRDKGEEKISDMILLPGLCGMSHYAVKITRSSWKLDVGVVVFHVRDGELLQVYPLWDNVDIRAREEI